MDFSKENIIPFVEKVAKTFSKEFAYSKVHLERGALIMQKIGYDNIIMVSNICEGKYLMSIMIGGGVVNVDFLVKTPEEVVENMTKYMPFIEAWRADDEEDEDEPIQYSVDINCDEIYAAYEEWANEPCDWKPTFFD